MTRAARTVPLNAAIEAIMVYVKVIAEAIQDMDGKKLPDALLAIGWRRRGFSSARRIGEPGTPDAVCGGCGKKGSDQHQHQH